MCLPFAPRFYPLIVIMYWEGKRAKELEESRKRVILSNNQVATLEQSVFTCAIQSGSSLLTAFI